MRRKLLSLLLAVALVANPLSFSLWGIEAQAEEGEGLVIEMKAPGSDASWTRDIYNYDLKVWQLSENGTAEFEFRLLVDGSPYQSGNSNTSVSWYLTPWGNDEETVPEETAIVTAHEDGTATVTVKEMEFVDIDVHAVYDADTQSDVDEPVDIPFNLYGRLQMPALTMEFWNETKEAWVEYDNRWILEKKDIPAEGKEYRLRILLDGKAYEDIGIGDLTWNLYSEGDGLVSLVTDEQKPGEAVLKLMPGYGIESFTIEISYDFDGSGGREPEYIDKPMEIFLCHVDALGCYIVPEEETEGEGFVRCSVIGVKPNWNGTLPSTVTCEGEVINEIGIHALDVIVDSYGTTKRPSVPKLVIPKQVNSISSYAFRGLKNLAEIQAEAGHGRYISKDGVLFERMDEESWTLVHYPVAKPALRYEIPKEVKALDPEAFRGFGKYKLQNLVVHDDVDFSGNGIELFEKFIERSGWDFEAWNLTVWLQNNKSLEAHGALYADADSETSPLPMRFFKDINETKMTLTGKTVTLSATSYTYDGTAKTPAVTVAGLVQGKDYTVTYQNHINVGTATVVITGMGDYTGTLTKNFTIVQPAASKPAAPAAPGAVSGLKAVLYGYDDVKVSWKASSGATSYKVYRKYGSGSYTLAKTTTALSYKAANLEDGRKVTFKVVPYNGGTAGSEKTAFTYTLKKVTDVKAAKSGSKVKVSWKNIDGETGYQISKMTTKKGTQKKPTTYKTTTGKYKKLSATKGKTYYYKVRAYKTVNGKNIYGPWSTAKKFKR